MSKHKHLYDWEEVAQRNPKGYAEFQNEERILHGPIESVSVDERDVVHIKLKWAAISAPLGKPGFGEWRNAPEKKEVVFPNLVVPFVFEPTPSKGERVSFGFNVLYLGNVEGLDPAKVEGLDLTTA